MDMINDAAQVVRHEANRAVSAARQQNPGGGTCSPDESPPAQRTRINTNTNR